MPTKRIALLAVLVAAVLLVVTPLGAQAAKLITGKQVKDSSLTGKDVDERSLGRVPSAKTAASAAVANGLAVLKSGETRSGAFAAAGANSSGAGGWLGFAINYPQPLAAPIDEDNIIDTHVSPDPVACPGAGQAAPGYLCLYFYDHVNVADAFGWSEGGPYGELPVSVGVGMYAVVTGDDPYLDGIWTVTAP